MGKHEIRLRRQRMTASGADRFRNYRAVLERHEQDQKMKKIFRFFTYFLAVVVILLFIFFLNRWEKNSRNVTPHQKIESTVK